MANKFEDRLLVARNAVNEAVVKRASWAESEPSVTAWFNLLKDWESDDNFDIAFAENRMTMRITKSEIPKDPPTYVKTASWNAEDKTYQLDKTDMVKSADFVGIERKHFVERANPANFANPGDKLTKGMLELPCQLLNHTKKIAAQLYPVSTTGWGVFMPVPQQADLTLYYTLREIAKQENAGAAKMREIRSKLTRIKLAQDHDMHTGVVALSDKNDGRMHYRYGYTGTEKDPSKTTGIRNITNQERKARFDTRLNYQSVLLSEGVYNETVLAYRHHGSGVFPLFVDWPGLAKIQNKEDPNLRLAVINVSNVGTGHYVTNNGHLV